MNLKELTDAQLDHLYKETDKYMTARSNWVRAQGISSINDDDYNKAGSLFVALITERKRRENPQEPVRPDFLDEWVENS